MGPLRELLAADQRQTLEFFFVGLKDVAEPCVDRQELLYNASVLAHYAQISTRADGDWPAPANLSAVFDHFVADTTLLNDGPMMETALRQSLIKSKGGFSIFFTRPISAVCLIIAIALIIMPLLPWFRRRRPGVTLEQDDVT